MKEIYKTVKNAASAELIEKRSRFIASVKPVSTETEAVEFINSIRQKYRDATHNVYAYIIEENNLMRHSDDGEPSGTAGMPVLDILKKEDLTNLVVVVTRYFGGILLGTGGLVHAYSKSAKQGVVAAQPIEMVLCRETRLKCGYTLLGRVQNTLRGYNLITGGAIYTDKVEIPLFIPIKDFERIKAAIIETTNANAEFTDLGSSYAERIIK